MRRAQGFTGGGLATVGLVLLSASIDPGRVTDAAALVLLAIGVALVGQVPGAAHVPDHALQAVRARLSGGERILLHDTQRRRRRRPRAWE